MLWVNNGLIATYTASCNRLLFSGKWAFPVRMKDAMLCAAQIPLQERWTCTPSCWECSRHRTVAIGPSQKLPLLKPFSPRRHTPCYVAGIHDWFTLEYQSLIPLLHLQKFWKVIHTLELLQCSLQSSLRLQDSLFSLCPILLSSLLFFRWSQCHSLKNLLHSKFLRVWLLENLVRLTNQTFHKNTLFSLIIREAGCG